LARHTELLTADEGLTIIPVRATTDATTRTIKTRTAAFIPFELVPLLIDRQYTAREAFLVVHAHLTTHGVLDACAPLLDFLQVAGTFGIGDTIGNALTEPGPPFRLDKHLTEYMREKVLYRDLPSLRLGTAAPLPPAMERLTAAVTTFADAHLKADAANEKKLWLLSLLVRHRPKPRPKPSTTCHNNTHISI
jgi:hypothetical protein